jgi:hypothetical protein
MHILITSTQSTMLLHAMISTLDRRWSETFAKPARTSALDCGPWCVEQGWTWMHRVATRIDFVVVVVHEWCSNAYGAQNDIDAVELTDQMILDDLMHCRPLWHCGTDSILVVS